MKRTHRFRSAATSSSIGECRVHVRVPSRASKSDLRSAASSSDKINVKVSTFPSPEYLT